MSPDPQQARDRAAAPPAPGCCAYYHEAVELIGRRWTGAIVAVLIDHGPLRFSELRSAVPGVSDRLLSERVKELEARGVVERAVDPGPPISVHYDVTPMGRELQPALAKLRAWAQQWLA
ncbi:MAG: winged helix-turn-helix transcriptional regulator [Solirubrobacteraceae bacterium]